MTFEEKLALAFAETAEERAAEMLTVEQEHKFSLAYRLWEYRTLKKIKQNRFNERWTLRRARKAVAAAAVAASLVLATAVYAAGTIGRYSFDTHPEYSKLIIENVYSDKTRIEDCYGLPEEDGWKVIERYVEDWILTVNYEGEDKKVSFDQRIITENMGHINTEGTQPEPISLYKDNDGFLVAFKSGEIGLFWIYDGYFFSIMGNITKEEAIDLAYSTKIVNF